MYLLELRCKPDTDSDKLRYMVSLGRTPEERIKTTYTEKVIKGIK